MPTEVQKLILANLERLSREDFSDLPQTCHGSLYLVPDIDDVLWALCAAYHHPEKASYWVSEFRQRLQAFVANEAARQSQPPS